MDERYEGPPFDLGMGFHCGELHKRIGELLTMLSKQVGYPLVECTRCGDVMISQTPDNGVTNEAMDACGRCSYEMFYLPTHASTKEGSS